MGITWRQKSAEPVLGDVEGQDEAVAEHKVAADQESHDEADIASLFDFDKSKLNEEQLARLENWKDAIQPHTDEGGDAYYIGDAYERIDPTCAREWQLSAENEPEYLKYVKSLSETLPHLEYLAHWMEVGAAPPKWRFLRNFPDSRQERVARTRVCVVDYATGKAPSETHCTSVTTLHHVLDNKVGQPEARLLIVEDLSRDLVAFLGEHYDIDPLFFLSHINDYLFHNTRDRWVELPNLDVDSRRQTHFQLQYLRPRYFETEGDFNEAERQSGMFNVLRRLDSDRSRKRLQAGLLDKPGSSVTLSRAKTSLWIQPRIDAVADPTTDARAGAERQGRLQETAVVSKTERPIIGILLVDPTVTTGYPLWGGYRPFDDTPSLRAWKAGGRRRVDAPPSMRTWHEQCRSPVELREPKSLYDDVVYHATRITRRDLELIKDNPKHIANPMYRLIIADWYCVLKYMTTMLGKLEWEFEIPHWGEKPSDMQDWLKKISPWRRNVGYYQGMISDAISRLFPSAFEAQLDALGEPSAQPTLVNPATPSYNATGLLALWTDFKNIKQKMNESQARIKSIEAIATNTVNIEEARRAVQQNKNLARLTFLATIFIPLNFTSSFLSMSPDFAQATQTIWMFFVIGIPITLIALISVDLSHPQESESVCRQTYRRIVPKKKKQYVPPRQDARTPTDRSETIPWVTRMNTQLLGRNPATKR